MVLVIDACVRAYLAHSSAKNIAEGIKPKALGLAPLQVAVAFTLAYPYGTAQVMSSYTFSGHDDGAPIQHVYNDNDSDNCNSATWVCQHRFPEIANMASHLFIQAHLSLIVGHKEKERPAAQLHSHISGSDSGSMHQL